MPLIKMFKAKKTSKSINLNQDVWVVNDFSNHIIIRYKFRGKGRYITSTIDKWNNNGTSFNPVIGVEGLKEIEVDDLFYCRCMRIKE